MFSLACKVTNKTQNICIVILIHCFLPSVSPDSPLRRTNHKCRCTQQRAVSHPLALLHTNVIVRDLINMHQVIETPSGGEIEHY